jgi:RES domain-containing protein
MTMAVWRIGVELPGCAANDLSGTGAKLSGGRWNSVGTPIVYCATSIALATLETILHLRSAGLPFNRYLVRIDIPDIVWGKRMILRPVPAGWDAIPAGQTSQLLGDRWAAASSTVVLLVPSVVVPDEDIVLINPLHADATAIKATTLRRWTFDPRLFP